METLFIYLVKVNIALTMFYLVYVGLLRKDTFLRLKRFYLFAAIVFSLVYPLFTIEVGGNIFSFLRKNYAAEVLIGQPSIAPETTDASPGNRFFPLHGENVFFFVMMAGTAFFLVRFIWQLITIFRIKHKSVPKRIGTQNIYHLSEKMMPFSFFRWIFVNTEVHSEEELKQILMHEQIHVQQWHSLDILLAESLCIFFWWNPIVWLMKKEIAINLEYLADSEILRKGVNSRDYQYHLLRLTYRETAVQIVNNFNISENIHYPNGVDPLLDEEAVRVIKSMPKWEPGRQKGKIVDVRFTLPIVFRLQPSGKPVQNSTDNAEGKISDTDTGY